MGQVRKTVSLGLYTAASLIKELKWWILLIILYLLVFLSNLMLVSNLYLSYRPTLYIVK